MDEAGKIVEEVRAEAPDALSEQFSKINNVLNKSEPTSIID